MPTGTTVSAELLSGPGESFQTTGPSEGPVAESIFIAGLFVYAAPDFIELCRRRNLPEEAKAAACHMDAMKKAVLQHGYDGEWFLRAYDAAGEKVGSKECEEGKIFIEPQGFVMAGVGSTGSQVGSTRSRTFGDRARHCLPYTSLYEFPNLRDFVYPRL